MSPSHAARLAFVSLLLCARGFAATLHVWEASPSPESPYNSWNSAAPTIQAAINSAAAGDIILVTNGYYATGAVFALGISNRVFIDKAVRVLSVNGPEVTIIAGQGGLSPDAVRCVYLADGALLSGFTLTNGFTRVSNTGSEPVEGGGALCQPTAVISNSIIRGCGAYNDGGGVRGGTVYNSWLDGNVARDGGAADRATLYNCVISNNSAEDGGGVDDSVLYGCILTNNVATSRGGAAFESTFYNCTATGNKAHRGGGVAGRVTGGQGDAVYNSIVINNRALFGPNYDPHRYSVLFAYSCTLPLPPGPGNTAADPLFLSATRVSTNSPCVGAGSPLYAFGVDIDGESWRSVPSMGADEIRPGSVVGYLRVKAQARYTNVVAGFPVAMEAIIDGAVSQTRWSFGDGRSLTDVHRPLHAWSEVGTYPVVLTAFNDANPAGVSATVVVTVASSPDRYVNKSNSSPAFPFTSWTSAAVEIQQAIDSVTAAGTTIWVADGIYDTGGDAITNGARNRVALRNAVRLRSVNGPRLAVIKGGFGEALTRCAYIGHDSLLSGFTLTNGTTAYSGHRSRDMGGGGAWAESSGILENCIVVSNYAAVDGGGVNGGRLYHCRIEGNMAADDGGGVDDSVLFNCVLTNNLALQSGGGAAESVLENCTVSGNNAWANGGGVDESVLLGGVVNRNNGRYYAGGVGDSYLYNCTIVNNTVEMGSSAIGGSTLINCISVSNSPANFDESLNISFTCTMPLPENGVSNIDQAPRFVDFERGDFRLASDSPCIDRGTLITNFATLEFSGTRRSADGNGDGTSLFDMGAFEFIPVRPLTITRPNSTAVRLTWPGAPGVILQRSSAVRGAPWADVPGSAGQSIADLTLDTGPAYFRLLQP